MGDYSSSATPSQRLIKALRFFLISAVVVGLDQLSKYLIRTFMDLGESIPAEGFFRLTYTTNTGGAFSIFANQNFLLSIAGVLGIIILVVYLRFVPIQSKILKLGLGLDLGGAIGNLIDRLRFGEVTDFIDVDLGFWPFDPWPTFNIADSCIVIGSFLIAYFLIFQMGKKPT